MGLMPLPEHKETMLAMFADLADAANTVSRIISAGILPATLEFLDNATICCVEDFKGIGLPKDAAAMLLIETDGIKEAAQKEAKAIVEICKQNKATSVELAKSEAERDNLWAGRQSALAAITRLDPSLVQAIYSCGNHIFIKDGLAFLVYPGYFICIQLINIVGDKF